MLVQIATDGNDASNAVSHWASGFTLVPDHSANLPATTDKTDSVTGFTSHPFGSATNNNYWSLSGDSYGGQGFGYRWECDDYHSDSDALAFTTTQQVWVRALLISV